MSSLSTKNRMFFLTPDAYGEDDLLVEHMEGSESLSRLFKFRFKLLSYHDDIDARKLIGKPCGLRVETWDGDVLGGERHWNGYVSSFHRTGRAASPDKDGYDLYTYECELVPWIWFMGQQRDFRIFQEMSIPDIIEKLLKERGFSDYELNLKDTHPALEYCTQFNETTYDFISRLLEYAGIWVFYKHNVGKDSKHVLVFTDNNESAQRLEPGVIPFHHQGHAGDADAITALASQETLRTGKISLRDWDFTRKAIVSAESPTMIHIGGNDALEHYHYAGGHVKAELGKHLTEVMMEAEEAIYHELHGSSQVRTLEPGYTFELADHPLSEFDRKYLITSVKHSGSNNVHGDQPAHYSNQFTCMPADVPYRSRLDTRRPRVYGPQTAIVVGPKGEEIHTNEHGQVKVQFHWDRLGENNDKSSCWVRVAQLWAGNGYGTMFIPRIGMEVVVDFLGGDPDQPIVIGCVYNGINKPPYELPANATRSTFKTLSSKGGGGTNELRFEDKKGKEEVFIQAQKDMNVLVKATRIEQIGADAKIKIAGKEHRHVVGDQRNRIEGKLETGVGGDIAQGTLGGMAIYSKGPARFSSEDAKTFIMAPSADIHLSAALNLVAVAGVTLSLKAGPSSIVLDPSGVSITGPIVKINSGGSPLAAETYSPNQNFDVCIGVHASKDGKVTDPLQQAQAHALKDAAKAGQPFCAECEAAKAALAQMGAL